MSNPTEQRHETASCEMGRAWLVRVQVMSKDAEVVEQSISDAMAQTCLKSKIKAFLSGPGMQPHPQALAEVEFVIAQKSYALDRLHQTISGLCLADKPVLYVHEIAMDGEIT